MRLSTRRSVALATLLLGAGAACNSVTGPEHELVAARARWAQRGPTTYRMTVVRSCECLPKMSGPVVLTVTNGTVEQRVYERGGTPVPPSYAELFPSVDGLFARLEAMLHQAGTVVTVRYDPTLGYPTRIAVGESSTEPVVTTVTALEAR